MAIWYTASDGTGDIIASDWYGWSVSSGQTHHINTNWSSTYQQSPSAEEVEAALEAKEALENLESEPRDPPLREIIDTELPVRPSIANQRNPVLMIPP